MTVSAFKNLEDDALKADTVFGSNIAQWISIRQEVKEWVQQNWERWRDEKPTWLDENMQDRIPPDMIPGKRKTKYIAKKRKDSNKEMLLKREESPVPIGGRRASIFGGRRKSTKVSPVGGEIVLSEEKQMALAMSLGRRGSM